MSTVASLGRVLLPFGFGYFLSFLYRTVNAVIGPEVAASLGLGAAELGLLTSAYFVAFAAFQIPLGVLLDRYGPRHVEAALLLVAAAGAVVFARGESTLTLALGRALIGLGVSACLMGAMKANAQWWPRERLPLANGAVLAMGGIGAVVATAPVQHALTFTDWRGVFIALSALTLAAAATILLVVPPTPSRPAGEAWGSAFRAAVRVFAEPAFLRVAPLAILTQGSFLAYHGLWAAVWLRDLDGLDRVSVGTVLAVATTGIIFGTFGIGLAADRLARRGVPALTVAVAGAVAYLAVQLGLVLRLPVPHGLIWGAFAFFGMSSTLFYAVLVQMFPAQLGGRVNTALNMLVFIAAFLLQWLIGVVLGVWTETGGASSDAHRGVMAAIICAEVAALVWLVRAARTGSRSE